MVKRSLKKKAKTGKQSNNIGHSGGKPEIKPGTISLCMIVKNEEHNLPRCLDSVRDYVDEMIVVDTGSEDRTVEIAESYGAKVFHFDWCDNFATARNYAIERATGGWILVLDADEALELEYEDSLQETVLTPRPGFTRYSLNFVILMERNGEQQSFNIFLPRLFPNHPRIRFVGNIHEQIVILDGKEKMDEIEVDAVSIIHYGYLPSEYLVKNKDERNLKLLETAIENNPNDPFGWFNLGLQHSALERYAESVESFQNALNLIENSGMRFSFHAATFTYLLGALLTLRRYREAVAVGIKATSLFDFTALHFNLGTAYGYNGNLVEALEEYQKAMNCSDSRRPMWIDRSFVTWRPREAMATINFNLGNRMIAYDLMKEALEFEPDHTYLVGRTAQIAIAIGLLGEARCLLTKAIGLDPGNISVRCELATLLMETAEADAALEVLGPGLDICPDAPMLYERLGAVLSKLGRYEDAKNAYSIALSLEPNHSGLKTAVEAMEILSAMHSK